MVEYPYLYLKDVPTLRLRLTKPKHRKSVQWTETTVDNEHMNKKKSKCCCIYEKPKTFEELLADEDEEEDDEECENCHGHVDRRRKPGQPHEHSDSSMSNQDNSTSAETVENSSAILHDKPASPQNNEIGNTPHAT